MTMPSITNFTAVYDAFVAAHTHTSNLKDNLDMARKILAMLTSEANGVILKVWDDVATFYNEEPRERQHDRAREWGVVYINRSTRSPILGQAKEPTSSRIPVVRLRPAGTDTYSATDFGRIQEDTIL